MTAYLVRRIVYSGLVLVAVMIAVFLLGHMIGDPAKLMLPQEASETQYLELRRTLQLDDPLYVQFSRAAGGWLQGDFGMSLWQRVPAMPVALQRVPATLYLGGVTALVAFPIAILLGVVSAVRPRSLADRLLTVFSLGGVSIAEFWLGLMLILVLAVQLGLLPTSGFGGLNYVVLPAMALSLRPIGRVAQVARSAMLDEVSKMYVTTARAKGLAAPAVIFSHALKNAAIPILTLCGDETAALFNGAVVVETIFGWPGIGSLTIQSILRRDLPLIEATVFIVATMVITLNLLVDLAYAVVDPRVRFGAAAR
ncbi:MAG: ABC transporter permease [Chloroflexi bacterium]|nr:ABC transporter permease [Chloroflexota bacterium]